jgi:ferredoxin-nitrite reductase
VLRAQLPNGEMTSEQMRFAASCIRPYGEDGCADITTRANLQLRGVKLEDAGGDSRTLLLLRCKETRCAVQLALQEAG